MCAVGSRVSARGCGAIPREVAPSRACGGQRDFLAGGQGEPLVGVLPVECTTTWAGLHNPALPPTHASPGPEGAAMPRPPQGCRGAAHGTNGSWRTNNLICWSTGGEPSWGTSLAVPAWPCPQGQPAASQGRGVGLPWWQSPPVPSACPVAPLDPPGAGSSPAHRQP